LWLYLSEQIRFDDGQGYNWMHVDKV